MKKQDEEQEVNPLQENRLHVGAAPAPAWLSPGRGTVNPGQPDRADTEGGSVEAQAVDPEKKKRKGRRQQGENTG